MPIPVICPCGGKMRVGDHLAGQHVKCPKCDTVLPVGRAAAPPAPPVANAPGSPPATTESVLAASGLSQAEQDRVEHALRSDERLVWADKPMPAAAFRRGWLHSSTFFIGFIMGGIILGLTLAEGRGNPWWLPTVIGLFTVGCLVCGLLFPSRMRWCAERTIYAFTTKRALVWYCNLLGEIKLLAYRPEVVARREVQLAVMANDGSGDIVFGQEWGQDRYGTISRVRKHGFLMVRNVDDVNKLLLEHLINPFSRKT
jgi:hypothetical protein